MTDIVSKVRQQRYRRAGTSRARGRRPLGAPILAGLVLWAGASLLLIGQAPVFHEAMVAGQRASVTILASVEFECVDHAATQLRRQQAADSVLPVFTVNMGPAAVHLRAAGKLVRRVADLRTSNAPPAAVQAELTGVIDLLGFGVAPEDALYLIPPGAEGEKVLHAITNALRTVWAEGIIGERDRAGSIAQLARQGQVLLEPSEGGAARIAAVASRRTPEDAAARFGAHVTAALAPAHIVLVADAGLGTLNSIRPAVAALTPIAPVTTLLNRYDDAVELHRRNRAWLVDTYGIAAVTALSDLADALAETT